MSEPNRDRQVTGQAEGVHQFSPAADDVMTELVRSQPVAHS